jgi:molybdopterin synthase catalytic subunit
VVETWITQEAIDPAQVLAQVGAPSHGAAVLFVGTVRDHNEGRPVARLSYEIYPSMAARVLEQIAVETAARWPGSRVAAVHRTGTLEIGEVSVAVAVSAPHRGDAFEAARHAIEAIKERLPVWKQERYADGPVAWLEGRTPPVPGAEGRADG